MSKIKDELRDELLLQIAKTLFTLASNASTYKLEQQIYNELEDAMINFQIQFKGEE